MMAAQAHRAFVVGKPVFTFPDPAQVANRASCRVGAGCGGARL